MKSYYRVMFAGRGSSPPNCFAQGDWPKGHPQLHRQQIYLVSPEHPCGAAWLANCFLELGILTYYSRYWQNMWRYTKGHYTLTPWHDYGKAWLPSSALVNTFGSIWSLKFISYIIGLTSGSPVQRSSSLTATLSTPSILRIGDFLETLALTDSPAYWMPTLCWTKGK